MLKNITTDHLVKRECLDLIFNAKVIGQTAVVDFTQVRLNDRSVSFWNRVKKMNLSTA